MSTVVVHISYIICVFAIALKKNGLKLSRNPIFGVSNKCYISCKVWSLCGLCCVCTYIFDGHEERFSCCPFFREEGHGYRLEQWFTTGLYNSQSAVHL